MRRRRPWAAPLAAAASVAIAASLAGCGAASDADGAVVVDTLANGAVRIASGAFGAWSEETPARLVEELRIGRLEGDGPDVFGTIRAIAVDVAGRIHVLDSQAGEVRVFDDRGEHLRTLGGPGSGPGELQNPIGLALHPSTGDLWVVDPGNGRYAVFDPTGAFVTTHTREHGFFAIPWPGGFGPDGRLHDIGLDDGEPAIVRLSPELELEGAFAYAGPEPERIMVRDASGSMIMGITPPFAPYLQVRFDPAGRYWTAVSDAFVFTEHDPRGDTTRVLRRPHEPIAVTGAEADSARGAVEEMIGSNAGPDARVDGGIRIPETKPAFRSFLADGEGRLWAERFPAREGPQVLELHDRDRGYLGPVEVEGELRMSSVLPQVRGDRLYGAVSDELGAPHLVRFRLETPR